MNKIMKHKNEMPAIIDNIKQHLRHIDNCALCRIAHKNLFSANIPIKPES